MPWGIIILISLIGTVIVFAISHHCYSKRYSDIPSLSLKDLKVKIDKNESDRKAIEKTLKTAKDRVNSFSIPIPEELSYDDGLASCSQLPSSKKLEALLALNIPSRKSYNRIKAQANSMMWQIDNLSNQNNAAILTWTAAIDGMYQEAMEDIRNFSNEEMKKLNETLSSWKKTMDKLEEAVIREANKLGIDRKQDK